MASRRFQLKYNINTDAEIIARLEEQESIQGYIRRLIQSDILADSLRGLFKIEERDPEDQIRIDWYNKHCAAINDPDYNCDSCYYFQRHHYGEDRHCAAEAYFFDYRAGLKHGE